MSDATAMTNGYELTTTGTIGGAASLYVRVETKSERYRR